MKRSPEPLVWLAFSGGGMAAALLVPVLLFLFGLAFPLGWIEPPSEEHLVALVRHPITKLVLFGLCALGLFHFAHRFRYTLYDGLKLKRFAVLIAAVCYGAAVVGSVASAIVLLSV
ncbi:hypothetical protein Lesp02_18380 [Lentzea sp. NBRC 105346]|uniref:fumarate reductase subunit FrdD n=1 Tax=Lentzea sp. NBRC 105346 TaxID=3032205 RepID=UPI0024A2A24C|nr:fumarate reductase subunit FrdD [Lentzea sp. NBRC 105346]GLZ29648.1 hypothetical protein Lesp02_18380 [Lentzea sp. NBRC 105346]